MIDALFAPTPQEDHDAVVKILKAERAKRVFMLSKCEGNKMDYWNKRIAEIDDAIYRVDRLFEGRP